MIKLAAAKKGFVLLPKRWVIERSLACAARFRRLAKHYERLPDVPRRLHFLVFAILMLLKPVPLLMTTGNSQHALSQFAKRTVGGSPAGRRTIEDRLSQHGLHLVRQGINGERLGQHVHARA